MLITCFRQQLTSGAVTIPNIAQGNLVAGNDIQGLSKRAAKKAKLSAGATGWQEETTAAAAPVLKKWSHSGTVEICSQYNRGKCNETKTDGASGANTCLKHEHRIHACDSCGQPGHPASICPAPVSYSRPVKGKGKLGKAKGKGKNKKGKGKGKW